MRFLRAGLQRVLEPCSIHRGVEKVCIGCKVKVVPEPARIVVGPLTLYVDTNDWWVGAYRGPNHWYACPLPTLVIRWRRR